MIFRTYPALRYLLFLILGIWIYQEFQLSLFQIVLGFIACLVAGILAVSFRKLYSLRHLLPVSFFFLGAIVTYLYNPKNQPSHISHFADAESIMVKIASYTETKEKSYKVTAKVEGAYINKHWVPVSGKLLVYFNHAAGVYPNYGEVYTLNKNWREIEAPKNPYEFNYKKYLEKDNIFYHQFLRAGDFKRVGKLNDGTVFYWVNKAQLYTHTVFSEVLENNRLIGVAEAIVGGMRSELDRDLLQEYAASGVVHALAVSGMHVGILFWVLNLFFASFLNKRKLPFLFSILFSLWAYAIFTGLSPSVCRATLMFTIFQVGMFINRSKNPVNSLFFSALVLLMIVPLWIYDVGFQLSYMAVLGILVLYPRLSRIFEFNNIAFQWLWDISCISLAAQIFTLPLALYYFHQFPNYFLLANPLVSLLCIPLLPCGFLLLFFYKVPLLGSLLGILLKWILVAMNAVVYFIQSLPNSLTENISVSVLGIFGLYFLLGIFLLFLKSKRIQYAHTFLLGVVAMLFFGSLKIWKQSQQKELTFHYIPNGYGISLINGRAATFLSSDSLINEPLIKKYHLKNYYDAMGIKNNVFHGTQDAKNELLKTDLVNIFWVKEKKTSEIIAADYILISNNSLNIDTDLNSASVILDGTNHKWYIDSFKKKHPNLVVLYETGSKTFNLNE